MNSCQILSMHVRNSEDYDAIFFSSKLNFFSEKDFEL